MANISLNEGLYRIGGMYGHVVIDGKIRAEITEVTGSVEIARIDVPLVGTTRQGAKPGRESREGTFRVQKIDTFWELEVYKYLSQGLRTRRDNRGTAEQSMRPFTIQLWLDDPDALDKEVWQLEGCLIWRLPLGFSVTDDLVDREFPFTWEKETPLHAFHVDLRASSTNANTGFPTVVTDHTTEGV